MARSSRSRVRPEVDTHAASELRLYLDNDAKLYARRKSYWQNIARKMITGKYDPEKAAKLWLYHVDEAARAYDVEFGSGGKRASPYSTIRVGTLALFDKPTREAVARELAADEERAIRGGEYGDLYTLAGRKPPKTKSNPGDFSVGQRVACMHPVTGKMRKATVIDPTGRFGYQVDRRVVVPVRYDSGAEDCVPKSHVFLAHANPAKLGGKVGRAAQVLADYRWKGLRAARANPGRRMTMLDVKNANANYHEAQGHNWSYFDRKTSRFFGGDKFWGPYAGPGGVFFVQQNRAGVKVKQMDPSGYISSVPQLPGLQPFEAPSLEYARSVAKAMAKGQ